MIVTQVYRLNYLVLFSSLILALFPGCKQEVQQIQKEGLPKKVSLEGSELQDLTKEDLRGFIWMNEPSSYEFDKGILRVQARSKTDFFNDPGTGDTTATAPFLFKEQAGDFVATAWVKPDFNDMWNAASLMVYIDEVNWIKFAFENSDATGKGIVTVVTRGISDDANGVVLTHEEAVWLKIVKKDNLYAMHWSTDGLEYKMARLSAMKTVDSVKIGLEAQCPAGEGALHEIVYFSLEEKRVEDLRSLTID